MYQHPDQYGQPRDWPTTQSQQQQQQPQPPQQPPLPSIQHMASSRMLPGMHAMNSANNYQSGPYMPQQSPYAPQHYLPQQHYVGQYSGAQLPPQMPPQMQQQMPPQMPQEAQPQQAVRPMELSRSGSNDQYRFTLVVQQQPMRARMCGFGDKDRRPITPPPCVRLLIHDMRTGKEVDADTVNGSFFVLQVDLWNEKADREANVVRASNTSSPSASISTATTTSFPPIPDRSPIGMIYGSHQGMNGMTYGYPAAPAPQQNNNSMFTRNLIGSLTVNAAKLEDDNKKSGYWFVLQDLSVRTEGHFRLRMNFIDVGIVARGAGATPSLNRGRAPVLAHVFSNPFQVYSAKKFPGVIESTELSKTFAKQGVKIPIRKDAKEGKEEYDDDA
ncbi:hypothetical protein LTR10_009793 [Elasticomyces elasticus]|uniref:Velvet domain-containing protein n=1 Tax=Elasticomyces elasticus TaxID=574655 RepID=A0AAN7W0K3_9PEZI|nr:hypothetical protein LTR10_009793 [Elasticomyces elasticus]KAK4970083.1 hypothetical protein LTR42_008250 [Elasticomyces elasticus]KAK5693586.1 hypothetical protein LTR97_010155 [Elasticomyces elasticus]KAK5720005.1 hypothetical protein LTR15_007278 [Elasticomyces elasticus]